MNQKQKKMSFWSVLSLVINTQIGSGILMLPAILAPFGIYSMLGWIVSAIGAMALASVFSQLCIWVPHTGGAHVFVLKAFGPTLAFFTGWTYWVISWVSTTVVIIACVGYILPFINTTSPGLSLLLELVLVSAITYVNLRGLDVASKTELFLTILKLVPLIVIPLIILPYFNTANFLPIKIVSDLTFFQILSRTTLLTFWCFIGLESATAPADSVENPTRVIPQAIIIGTLLVALLYILNNLSIIGVVPITELAKATAPYADAINFVFKGNWNLVISAIASIICLATFNAWVLTSSQIALGLAQDRLLPKIFGEKNKYNAPTWAIIFSNIGMIPLLIMTAHAGLVSQILLIIDSSVTAFLFVYLICCCAFFKILLEKEYHRSQLPLQFTSGIIATTFCCWIIYNTPPYTLLAASLFTLSGIPIYFYMKRKQ